MSIKFDTYICLNNNNLDIMKTADTTIQVTNQEIFNALVNDVDTTGLTHRGFDHKNKCLGYKGTISIEVEGESYARQITGDHGAYDYEDEFGFILTSHQTYDVQFHDDNDSNQKGFEYTLEECKNYIEAFNGTNESYFEDYKGGIVQIVNNQTGEVEFETQVK